MNSSTAKQLRLKRGLTRREVAAGAGVTEQTVYLIEEGKSPNPTIKTIGSIADFYGVQVDELLEKEGGASQRA